jgi:hypothetical protein
VLTGAVTCLPPFAGESATAEKEILRESASPSVVLSPEKEMPLATVGKPASPGVVLSPEKEMPLDTVGNPASPVVVLSPEKEKPLAMVGKPVLFIKDPWGSYQEYIIGREEVSGVNTPAGNTNLMLECIFVNFFLMGPSHGIFKTFLYFIVNYSTVYSISSFKLYSYNEFKKGPQNLVRRSVFTMIVLSFHSCPNNLICCTIKSKKDPKNLMNGFL